MRQRVALTWLREHSTARRARRCAADLELTSCAMVMPQSEAEVLLRKVVMKYMRLCGSYAVKLGLSPSPEAARTRARQARG